MSVPAVLTAVPVDELVDVGQHFRCVPYTATITARVCLERQRLHGAHFRMMPNGRLDMHAPASGASRRVEYDKCGNCPHGRRVRARLEGGEG